MKKILACTAGITLIIGCSGEKPTADDLGTDTETAGPECEVDDNCGQYEICDERQECVTGDRDDELDGASTIRLTEDDDGPNVLKGLIHTAGDVDHYAYESTGDEWLRLFTKTDDTVEDGLNTVVSVYRANGALHHALDDFGTGPVSRYDTLMNVYLPDAGTYYFKVEDVGTFYDDGEPRGQQSFQYDIGVQSWSSVTSESDSAEEPSITFNMSSGTTIYPMGVVIDEAGDADYTTVQMPHGDAPFEIWAPESIAGSKMQTKVEVTDPDGELIMVKDDVGPGGIANYFDAWNTTWNVKVSDARGDQGSKDHWTVLYFRTRAEGYGNARELEPNDTVGDATLIETESRTDNGDTFERGFLQSVLATPGDQDMFQVEGFEGGRLRVVCSSSRFGSLGDVQLEVLDPNGTSLGVFEDGDDSAPDVDGIEGISAGLHTLRFFEKDGGGSPGVYFRCGVYVYEP